jgi:hypothetical protein
MRRIQAALLLLSLIGLSACSSEETVGLQLPSDPNAPLKARFAVNEVFVADTKTLDLRVTSNPDRNAYFGDLHVHTGYSFDAYPFGTVALPADAYRYARGERIRHPGGFDVQLRQPLDFYAVTDHAMFLGVARMAADTSSDFSKHPLSAGLHGINAPDNMVLSSLPQRIRAFSGLLPKLVVEIKEGRIDREEVLAITRSAWRDTIEAADLWNDPGRFTTFAAYEYTSSTDDRGNLHRNVVFRDTEELPEIPFSRFHSQNPEGLWDWMDALREKGVESLAIPHNSNGSNGHMFKLVDWAGDPMDAAYGEQRLRNEPLVEITQVKGTSETHPSLSDTDEWAGFEIMPYRVATMLPSAAPGSYVRDALRRGLALESGGSFNPYEFGLVGSSDTHTGATSDDEANFFSKLGMLDSSAELRGSVPMGIVQATVTKWAAPAMVKEIGSESYTESASVTYGASGLAGVWAESNTRDALYDSLRRKETFATSGTRIPVRFFAGFGLDPSLLGASDMIAQAYAGGVAMGGDLIVEGDATPSFLAVAMRDPASAPLQRLQIIKGWEKGGQTFEIVVDVACSDGLQVDEGTGRCPDNGAKVNLDDCSISTNVGASELKAHWRDPDFDPTLRAFYYLRVLENPTCRWSSWDAIRAGVPARSDMPKTLQERAWSSPIQVKPAS